jgi:hypothetical protein
LLPEAVELVEGGLACQAALNKKATHHCAGATDTGAAMHIYTATRLQRIVETIENLGHVQALRRRAVIPDRLAQVFDPKRKLRIVGLRLVRLREVDETFDTGLDEPVQALAGGLTVGAAGMLSSQYPAG